MNWLYGMQVTGLVSYGVKTIISLLLFVFSEKSSWK